MSHCGVPLCLWLKTTTDTKESSPVLRYIPKQPCDTTDPRAHGGNTLQAFLTDSCPDFFLLVFFGLTNNPQQPKQHPPPLLPQSISLCNRIAVNFHFSFSSPPHLSLSPAGQTQYLAGCSYSLHGTVLEALADGGIQLCDLGVLTTVHQDLVHWRLLRGKREISHQLSLQSASPDSTEQCCYPDNKRNLSISPFLRAWKRDQTNKCLENILMIAI